MLRTLAVAAAILLVASIASASLPDVAIALHAAYEPLVSVENCGFVTQIHAAPYTTVYVHVIVCGHMYDYPRNDGFTAVAYDLYWPSGVNPVSWENLAPFCFGEPGIGIAQNWGEAREALCLDEMHPYLAGILTINIIDPSPMYVQVVAHPEFGAHAVDCHDMVWPITSRLGLVVINDYEDGYNPCPCVDPPNPVESATWGVIKSLYQ